MKLQPPSTPKIRFPCVQYQSHVISNVYPFVLRLLKEGAFLAISLNKGTLNDFEFPRQIWKQSFLRNILTHSSLKSELTVVLKRLHLLSGALWWLLSFKPCLIFFIIFAFIYLHI